jgi:hypothetical protein
MLASGAQYSHLRFDLVIRSKVYFDLVIKLNFPYSDRAIYIYILKYSMPRATRRGTSETLAGHHTAAHHTAAHHHRDPSLAAPSRRSSFGKPALLVPRHQIVTTSPPNHVYISGDRVNAPSSSSVYICRETCGARGLLALVVGFHAEALAARNCVKSAPRPDDCSESAPRRCFQRASAFKLRVVWRTRMPRLNGPKCMVLERRPRWPSHGGP